MVPRFEEISNNAWPALQTIQYDGWILRFANGVTRRSNSVNLLYPSSIDPDEKIGYCERLFKSRNISPCFKVTETADPADIDERLTHHGYQFGSVISFQSTDISRISPELNSGILLESELNPVWIDEFIRMNGFDPGRKPTYIAIMQQVLTPKCLVSVKSGKQTIGVGLGVAEGPYIGLFDIVIDPAFRRSGLGHTIVERILGWGREKGATTAYLQVLADNIPAVRLYEKTGFKETYRYWYRNKP